jgi:hypothetical protein
MIVIAVLALALGATILALTREIRLRRTLEKLVRLLLSRWRINGSPNNSNRVDPPDSDSNH